jgi:hypothetical protein
MADMGIEQTTDPVATVINQSPAPEFRLSKYQLDWLK